MALPLFRRRPLLERWERLWRSYRFACWLQCVLICVLTLTGFVSSGRLNGEFGTLLMWCIAAVESVWMAMSILLVCWTAVLLARGDLTGRERATHGPETTWDRRPEPAPLPRGTELALRREGGFAARSAGTGRLAEGGPLYARSAEAAATIVTLCQRSDLPVAQVFGSVQLCILEAMKRAGDDLRESRS